MINSVFFDYDGVIQNTGTVISQLHEIAKTQDDYNTWSFFSNMDWKLILSDAPMVPNSIDTVVSLSMITRVSILTCFSSYSEAAEKCKHINKILNEIPIILCPYNTPKSMVVPVKNSILIDDSSSNISDWIDKGGKGVIFGNQSKEYKSVQNMNELYVYIKEVLEL